MILRQSENALKLFFEISMQDIYSYTIFSYYSLPWWHPSVVPLTQVKMGPKHGTPLYIILTHLLD